MAGMSEGRGNSCCRRGFAPQRSREVAPRDNHSDCRPDREEVEPSRAPCPSLLSCELQKRDAPANHVPTYSLRLCVAQSTPFGA
jgi:hypothetical protein